MLDNLKQVEKTTGMTPERLKQRQKPPTTLYYLWEWYWQIKKLGNFNFTELKAWSELNGHELQPFEVNLMLNLNSLYEEAINGRIRKARSSSGQQQRPKRNGGFKRP